MIDNYKLQKLIFVLLILLFPAGAYAQSNPVNAFGFELGMSKDNAKKKIKSAGKKMVSNEVDTKDIRTIVFDGLLTEAPVEGIDNSKTELEFFDDKLMSYSLIVDYDNDADHGKLQDEFIKYLTSTYGDPQDSSKMLSYRIWKWDLQDTRLVFSNNSSSNKIRLNYIYKPLDQKKVAKEIEEKRRGGKEENPADQMFKDANYSKPKFYNY